MRKIKANKKKKFNKGALIASVDVGMKTMYGYWRCPDGGECKPFTFPNDRLGFNKFWKKIALAKKDNGLKEVMVGLESTGSYGIPFIHFIKGMDVTLVQVNPMHTKKLKELTGNSPDKTDLKDPKVIADIMELGHHLDVVVPEGAAAELRSLTESRDKHMERRTGLLNQIHATLFSIFPEFIGVMKGLTSKTAQVVIKECPGPHHVIALGMEKLVKLIKKTSRGKLGKQRAQELMQVAWNSVGISEGRTSKIQEIHDHLEILDVNQRAIDKCEKEMRGYLKQVPASRFILSIKGMGEITTAGLIGEVADFGQFKTLKELIKYAGLDLFEISSGAHRGTRRITKRGRSRIRKILFFSSLNMVRKGGVFLEKYRQYVDRGMKKIQALTAISKKVLGVIYALVRNQQEFIADYDKNRGPVLSKAA